MDLNSHGTDNQLEEYVFGRLSRSDLPALEEHLIVCAACRDRLDFMEAIAVGMKEVLGSSPAAVKTAFARSDWLGRFARQWLRVGRQPTFLLVIGLIALVAAISIFSGFPKAGTKFAPVASLQLTASRGEMPSLGPARELDLTLSGAPREGGEFRIEVVNATGRSVWSGTAGNGAAGVQVKVERQFGPGDYFVRLYSASGKMLREYGFRVRH